MFVRRNRSDGSGLTGLIRQRESCLTSRALWAAVLVVGALSAAGQAWGLSLVEDGKPVSAIVVPEKCDLYAEQTAANWLQEYVRKATGAELAIVTESKAPRGTLISVGHTQLAKTAGISTDDLKLDGCKLIVRNGALFLIGRDTPGNSPEDRALGTCKAVTTFLQTSLGVRWFIPSPEGEAVPQTKNIRVPDSLSETVASESAFCYCGAYPYPNPAHVAYDSYAKIKPWTVGGHSWDEWVPEKKYFKDHPEYFALINGKRTTGGLNWLCPSNPDVRRIMLENMRALFDAGYDWVQLGQADGMGYKRGICECPDCAKLNVNYRGDADDILAKYPCESILVAHKWLVDECRKSHPDKMVHLLMYGPTRMPSRLFDAFGDNVVGEVADPDDASAAKMCEIWKGKVRGFTTYNYWGDCTILPLGIMHELTPAYVARRAKFFHENNFVGTYWAYGQFGKNWGLWGPVYYTLSRLGVNPGLNSDALVKEYCDGIYGEAGPIMKLFFDQLYSRIDNIKVEGSPDTKSRFLFYYSPQVIRQLDSLLSRAERAAKTEKSKHWLKLTRDYFDYAKTVSNMFVAENAYQINPTRSNLLEVRDRVNDFEAYRERIFSYGKDQAYCDKWFPQYSFFRRYLTGSWDAAEVKYVRGSPADYGRIASPVTWDFDKKLDELGKALDKKYPAPRAVTPPKLDGRIDAAEWKSAPPQTLGEVSGGKADVETLIRVMYDAMNLYVAYECREPDIDKLTINKISRDGRIVDLDCVELMLDPENSMRRHAHFMAAPVEGAFYDARTSLVADIVDPMFGQQDAAWNPDWQYAFAIDKEKKQWSLEMAIPFKSLETKPPVPGVAWRGNFARERLAGRRFPSLSLWSPSDENSFHDLATYGELIFGE